MHVIIRTEDNTTIYVEEIDFSLLAIICEELILP